MKPSEECLKRIEKLEAFVNKIKRIESEHKESIEQVKNMLEEVSKENARLTEEYNQANIRREAAEQTLENARKSEEDSGGRDKEEVNTLKLEH